MDSNEESIATLLDSVHSFYEEAYATLTTHALQNGYGFKLQQSRPYNSSFKTYFNYRCDKSRTYNSQATIRQTSTRTTGCSFSVVITQASDQWKLLAKKSYHNHTSSLNLMTHNVHCRRTQAQKDTIHLMSKAGVAPKQILTIIQQQDPGTFVAATDIHNDRKTIRDSYLADRTLIKILLDKLSLILSE